MVDDVRAPLRFSWGGPTRRRAVWRLHRRPLAGAVMIVTPRTPAINLKGEEGWGTGAVAHEERDVGHSGTARAVRAAHRDIK